MAITRIWMRHNEHGGVSQFPVRAAAAWQARGWEPCDEPAELDPREDPRYVDLPAPKPALAAKPAAPKSVTAKPSDLKKEKADG